MAQLHGKHTKVTIDAEDYSAHSDSTEWSDETDMSETTTYGRKRKNYLAGLEDGKITVGGTYDDGAAGPAAIFEPIKSAGLPVEFVILVAGAGTGKPSRKVDVLVKTFTVSSPVADKVAWSAELQMVGDEIDLTPQA